MKFLEFKVVQANAKVERVSTKKLDDVLSSQKTFFDKTKLGYTGESSSTVNIPKEVKFVKAKELMVTTSTVEKQNVEKRMQEKKLRYEPSVVKVQNVYKTPLNV